MSRSDVLKQILTASQSGEIAGGLRTLAAYAGASNYLLVRWDAFGEDGTDFIISADWPFDLVRTLGSALIRAHLKTTEIERCLSAMQPAFVDCPQGIAMPPGLSRRMCMIPFDHGIARLALVLCFREGMIISQHRLNDVGTLCAYHLDGFGARFSAKHQHELSDREIECLSWIAEGKTSDEISLIIGISRNTVNNYITSIMRKTSTRTRSEAIAHAVRNNML